MRERHEAEVLTSRHPDQVRNMAAFNDDPLIYPYIASEFPQFPPPLPEAAQFPPPLPEAKFHQKLASPRPSWDRYFMEIAKTVSTRATCPRLAVGAVIVKDKRILSTGYNGSPPGLAHCTDDGCWIEDGHCVRVIHAEHNAVLQGARHGISLEGADCYCTALSCLGCGKALVSAGITRLVFGSDYRPDHRLYELGLSLEHVPMIG